MEPVPFSNRRRTTRSPVALSIDVERDSATQARELGDLSLDGAFLRGEDAKPGSTLLLAMELADDEPPLVARALVVRRGAEGVGVRFVGMRTKERVRIADRLYGDR